MARIQHIAILAQDTEQLAGFYKTAFGMSEAQRLPGDSGRWRIFLTDGHINLAILPCRAGQQEGLNHFGFNVDDVKQTAETAQKAGAQAGAEMVPQDGRGNEGFIKDPVGQRVDLSAQGWPIAPVKEGAAATAR